MKNRYLKLALMAAAAYVGYTTQASAQDAASWTTDKLQIRVRGIGVLPDVSSSVNIGGKADVGDALVPEVDFTYFVSDKVGLELIAGTAEHQVNYTGNANLGETWILPPTVTLQYHPMRGKDSMFSPYVGAGLNYSWFYGEEDGTGFTNLDVEGGLGYALQAGADVWLNESWGLNLDVKKIWLDIDADLLSGATPVHADVDLDPWIVGAGVSYRF